MNATSSISKAGPSAAAPGQNAPLELATGLTRQAPILAQPGLEVVFCSVRRTVSYDTAATMSNSTSLSASRRRVQRLRPFGAGLQATAIRCASWAPSSFRSRNWPDGRGRSAASGPSSTHRVRTRSTVEQLTSSASTMWSSLQAGPPGPSSALSRMRACIRVRAAAFPTRSNSSRYPLSPQRASTGTSCACATLPEPVTHQRRCDGLVAPKCGEELFHRRLEFPAGPPKDRCGPDRATRAA